MGVPVNATNVLRTKKEFSRFLSLQFCYWMVPLFAYMYSLGEVVVILGKHQDTVWTPAQ